MPGEITFRKELLLTGAGFTANFGGPLGRDMWAKIFNNSNLQSRLWVLDLLRDNFDFENVYSQVIHDIGCLDGSLEDKEAMRKAIEESFGALDKSIIEGSLCYENEVDFKKVKALLSAFSGKSGSKGLLFTLNQDLFMERRMGGKAGPSCVKKFPHLDGKQLKREEMVELPSLEAIETYEANHFNNDNEEFYIKLHGSYGWLSSQGHQQMVIGTNKEGDIIQEPLLNWYFGLFRKALFREGVKLLVIGYGFNDAHVNDILMEAIAKYDLKLYILSPEPPEAFSKRMREKGNDKIWGNIFGYFPYRLKDIFPPPPTGLIGNITYTQQAWEIHNIFPFIEHYR